MSEQPKSTKQQNPLKHKTAKQNPLGQSVEYVSEYQPDLLFAIPRSEKRTEISITEPLPFSGEDIWNAYEISWLNANGVPRVATAEFRFQANSPNIIESKSFKLYLNSFNQSKFESSEVVRHRMQQDLEQACLGMVDVLISEIGTSTFDIAAPQEANCIDHAAIVIDSYDYAPDLLKLDQTINKPSAIEEFLCSHLLKSNCLITSQPDWASVFIRYQGAPIDHSALLAYLVSFRNHNEFHEQCVERIYTDLMSYCKPEKLTVYARYTRRGGLDINPWRSNFEQSQANFRLIRQ